MERISYMTAWRWFRDGKLPVEAEQMPTGTIIVKAAAGADSTGVVLYARVSSAAQKPEMDKQIARLLDFASKKKLSVIFFSQRIPHPIIAILGDLGGEEFEIARLSAMFWSLIAVSIAGMDPLQIFPIDSLNSLIFGRDIE